ncbi:uncharacterized protein [Lepeophtheirus salmonis]|uniref:uncharacterized protein n=1 Tax=Lepeophtheirus salmonis TaxID=72036 RepID=UPI00077F4C32|nr:uncharacterized protein LOC121120167 isoform X1 [Lepeophtheirus salmonis]
MYVSLIFMMLLNFHSLGFARKINDQIKNSITRAEDDPSSSVEVPLCHYESFPNNESLAVTERVCSETTSKKCDKFNEQICSPEVCEKVEIGPSQRICRTVLQVSKVCKDYPCDTVEQKCKNAHFFNFQKLICYSRPKMGCKKCEEEPYETEVCDIERKKKREVCRPGKCEYVVKERCRDVPVRECRDVKRNVSVPLEPRLVCNELLRIPSDKLSYLNEEKEKE